MIYTFLVLRLRKVDIGLKNKLRINWVDIIFVLIFVSMLFVLSLGTFGKDVSARFSHSENADIYITVRTDIIDYEYAKMLKSGEVVLDAETYNRVGKILDVEINDKIFRRFSDGEVAIATVTIACEGKTHGDYFTVNDKKIIISDKRRYIVPGYCFTGTCIAVGEGYHKY